MIISVDARLASMLSAMTDSVLPALADNAFAAEQAQLVAGHLHVLRLQSEYAEEYEQLELRYLRSLAAEVSDRARGERLTTHAAALLHRLACGQELSNIREVREAHRELGDAFAAFLEAEGEDGTPESVEWSTRTVLEAEYAQAQRDRSFNRAFGYEGSADVIASIEAMMATFRADFPTEQGARE
jgi:hypothetical protein